MDASPIVGPLARQPRPTAVVVRLSSPLGLLTVASPLAVVTLLLVIYQLAPEFYLTYVLEYQRREYQAVEMLTFGCATVGGLLLLYAFARAANAALPSDRLAVERWGPSALLLLVGLASLFFAGEEVSWGQTFTNWGIPENQKADPRETNLHNNMDIPLQSLGQVFLAAVFFALPVLWAVRDRVPLPASFGPVVPTVPVIIAAAIAFGWKLSKEIYEALFGREEDDAFFWGFVEQINEQRELLVALALLLYAIHVHVARHRQRALATG